jgi:WD40 repeat protein
VPRLLFRFLCIFAFAAATLSCIAADRVLFTRLGPTQSTLFIANVDGSAERPLTQPDSLNYNPAWSPTGDWIAFTSERGGPANLFRMRPDGSDVERLTADAAYDDQAAFSPDGRQIAFVSTRAEGFANLWVLDLATRKARALTTGRGGDFRPAWSPDGQWIAFSSDRDSSLPTAKSRWERLQLLDIYLIHPDGSGLKRISEHGNFCGNPKWTPDSRSVVTYCMSAEDTWTDRTKLLTPYAADAANQVYRIDIATGSILPITSGPGVKLAPSVLASGKVAYLRGDGARIEIVSGDGKVGQQGQSGTFSVTVTPTAANLGSVLLTCSGLPATASCTLTSPTMSFTSVSPQSSTLTVSVTAAQPGLSRGPSHKGSLSVVLAGLFLIPTLLVGKRGSSNRGVPWLLRIGAICVMSSCAGLSGCGPDRFIIIGTPLTYQLAVQASAVNSGLSKAATLTLVVTQ